MTKAATKPATRASRKKAPATAKPDRMSQLTDQLKELRLPTIRDRFQESAVRAETENLSHLDYLSELTTRECEARREGRIRTTDDAIETSSRQDMGCSTAGVIIFQAA